MILSQADREKVRVLDLAFSILTSDDLAAIMNNTLVSEELVTTRLKDQDSKTSIVSRLFDENEQLRSELLSLKMAITKLEDQENNRIYEAGRTQSKIDDLDAKIQIIYNMTNKFRQY